ncbi:protein of unknown function [Halovenus aranensis]|uniref:DUF4330 domain-containing protein n=1 Tax=Halovenus aranensis TaxID=890420 RepID=A0A1G8VVK0_9EURY|nr:DUF4330 family protein [Halovenus aranensis]SDJ69999.1 protein of unknown function [Halovenus aranensis]
MKDSDDDSRRFLDDEGRLFGLVNIVDALVVLLVLAVVVAGVALLLPSSSGETETRYVTLDLGDQPDYLAEEITPGDEWAPERTSDSITITDVYRFNNAGNGTSVLARAAVNGTEVEPEDPTDDPIFEFRGNPLLTGQTYTLVTSEYEVEGAVTRVESDGETLPVTDSELVLETSLAPTTASEIEVGDQYTAGGDVLGEVTAFETFAANQSGEGQYTLIGLTTKAIERSGSQYLGDTRVAVGQSLTFDGGSYSFSGEIIDRGTSAIPANDSEFVIETTLPAATADEIEAGDEFTAGGTTFGEVTALELFPGAGDGDQRYALVGVTARTVERDGAQYIGNIRAAIGQSLTFDGDGYSFGGEIIDRGIGNLTTKARPLVVRTEVPATVASDINVGDQFDIDGVPIVSVDSVTVYPTANPDVRRVVLGVSAKTRTEGGTLLFGDRQLRIGSQLPIRTDNYDIQTEIIRRGGLNEPGSPTTQTVTIQLKNIPPERAASLTSGMTEENRDKTTAEVQNVTTQPAEIVLESEGGDIFLREHPQNKDVELTVDLSVRELDGGTIRFRGETLRVGQDIALELGPLTVNGEVIGFEE